MKHKIVFNWSGGKDSALALRQLLQDASFEVIALLTTVSRKDARSVMHAIPQEILSRQAESIGIPLYPLFLSHDAATDAETLKNAVMHFKDQGVDHFGFGDIFLHDVKKYREEQLSPYGITVVEPLWEKKPGEVMAAFLDSGIKARIVVTQADKLGESYIGRELDRACVESFPADVDPCGENGEYHTLVYGGPFFRGEVAFSLGKTEKRSAVFKLDTGESKLFEYYQAEIRP